MAYFVDDRVALRSAGPGPLSGLIPLTVAGILDPAATALLPRLAATSATIGALERADVQVVVIRQAVAGAAAGAVRRGGQWAGSAGRPGPAADVTRWAHAEHARRRAGGR
jgi:hypothetical protein